MSTVKIFVGMMRPRYEDLPPRCSMGASDHFDCRCNSDVVFPRSHLWQHWQEGHFDTPVYAEVDPVEVAAKAAAMKGEQA